MEIFSIVIMIVIIISKCFNFMKRTERVDFILISLM